MSVSTKLLGRMQTTNQGTVFALIPLAAMEAEAIANIPLQSYQLALLTGVVPLAVLIVLLFAKQDVKCDNRDGFSDIED